MMRGDRIRLYRYVKEIGNLRHDLAYLRGRLEHMPTTWTLITTITASQPALLGFTFAMLRYLAQLS